MWLNSQVLDLTHQSLCFTVIKLHFFIKLLSFEHFGHCFYFQYSWKHFVCPLMACFSYVPQVFSLLTSLELNLCSVINSNQTHFSCSSSDSNLTANDLIFSGWFIARWLWNHCLFDCALNSTILHYQRLTMDCLDICCSY